MNATGQMLSAILGWSQATFASEVGIDGDSAVVTREVDGGLQTIKVKMPTVVSVDLRLNEPRYASLPNIMKAKKKPLDEKTPADYGVDVANRLEIIKTVEPAERAAGQSTLRGGRNQSHRRASIALSTDMRQAAFLKLMILVGVAGGSPFWMA